MPDDLTELKTQIKALTEKLNTLQSGPINNDLGGVKLPESKDHKNDMFTIDMQGTDRYGDPVELATKARLANYEEARKIALAYMFRVYYHMQGGHSILIPVDGTDAQHDYIKSSFPSANIRIIKNGKDDDGEDMLFYKIRTLIDDVFINKYLLLTIPTDGGKARHESIMEKGINIMGIGPDTLPIKPLYASSYKKTSSGLTETGEKMFKEHE